MEKKPFLTLEQVQEIVRTHPTPFHIYDEKAIRENARNGLGIVYVQRNACGGCFNRIPAQRQVEVKLHKKVVVCEYCGRILIDPQLAGVNEEA